MKWLQAHQAIAMQGQVLVLQLCYAIGVPCLCKKCTVLRPLVHSFTCLLAAEQEFRRWFGMFLFSCH